jgi:hypothetical protein
MSSGVCIPATLVLAHMPDLSDMPVGQSRNISLQLVLLPPCAVDVTPGTESHVMTMVLLAQHASWGIKYISDC